MLSYGTLDWLAGIYSGLRSWLGSMLTNALQVRFQPGSDNFVLCVCCCVWFLASLCYQGYSYIHVEELTVWIVFPTVAIHVYKSSPLVPMDSCLTAAACLSSACSFAVSQASDLALLVGYVAYEEFFQFFKLLTSLMYDYKYIYIIYYLYM